MPLTSGLVPELVGEFFHAYCGRRVKVQVFSIPVSVQLLPAGGYRFKQLEHIEAYSLSSFHRKAFRLFWEFVMRNSPPAS
jgi:hypothetical protein